MPFLHVHPALERALAAQGYAEPTPVQAAVLEPNLVERDLLVSAQTGSGKTVAFGMAFAPTLLGDSQRFGAAGAPMALIIAPTRELALQVCRELTWLYAETGARIVTCVGGMDIRREQRNLAAGCHIVVGTPGRLHDHLDRGHLDLSELAVVTLDEADEMLDLGFREDLEAILEAAPEERRTLLFSATLAREIVSLAQTFQKRAERIDTTRRDEPHGDIEYRAIRVAPNEVELAVVNVLRVYDSSRALVFCSTRESVNRLNARLRERGFAVVALSGELSQKERSDALQALRDGHARVCVATDVAARGLDLPDLGLVIHAERPVNTASLLHRSGRTGRAGRKGVSVLLVPLNQRRRFEQLIQGARVEATWTSPPTAEEIRAGDQQRLLADPILTEPSTDEDSALAQVLIDRCTPDQLATALARLYRARLPEPEDLFDPGPDQARAPRERGEREEREPRDRGEGGTDARDAEFADAAWFRANIGRSKNADPKWLLPLICRLGHVTKKEIGQIRIFDRETKFQIAAAHADKFIAAVLAEPDDRIHIEPSTAPSIARGAPKRDYDSPRPPRREYNDRPPRERPAPVVRESAFRDEAPRRDAKPAYDTPRPPRKDHDKPAPRTDARPPRDFAPRSEAGPGAKPYAKSKPPYKKREGGDDGYKPRADKPYAGAFAKGPPKGKPGPKRKG